MINEGDILTMYNPYDEAIGTVTVTMPGIRHVWLSGEIRDPRWHVDTKPTRASCHTFVRDIDDDNRVVTENDSLNGYYAKKEKKA